MAALYLLRRLKRAKTLLHEEVGKFLMIQGACRSYNDISGYVSLPHVTFHVLPEKGVYGFNSTEDGPSYRVFRPDDLIEEVMDVIIRGILHHADLLEHHLAFLLQFFRVKYGIQEYVGQKVHSHGKVFLKDLGVKAGIFPVCERIQYPPHRVHLLGDVHGRAPFSPFKKHMLYEVGDPVYLLILMACPCVDPYSYGDGADMRDLLRQDPYAVI